MKKIIVAVFLLAFVLTSVSAYAGESFFQGLADAINGKSGCKTTCSSAAKDTKAADAKCAKK
ncbi:MAG TPA: hypothetical protein PKY78_05910 [Candidatus Omnitrophota bacterium]|nr:hypothetical protein [Candidatus Omnitrophota bacterium]HPS20504.1 hypothetical protein [Candidatus Omnitrophota bacterium]